MGGDVEDFSNESCQIGERERERERDREAEHSQILVKLPTCSFHIPPTPPTSDKSI